MLDDNQSSETKYGGASTARELAAFSVLAGILATFTLGYFYGLNNHLETLLPVVRILDPQFCRGDVVVAGLTAYGPRFYYSWICALAAKSLTLPGAMLALTLVQNVGIALVTGFAARDMYGCRSPAPFIAVILLLSVESIQLGWAGMLRQPYAQASNLGLVAAMFSLWQGIRLRPYVATAAAMLAGFVHPLVGLETGGVALAIGGMSALADASRPVADRRRLALRAVVGLAALALFAAIVWGPAQKDGALTTGEFLAIYGFRASHHVLPSLFRVRDYGFAGAFLAAAVLSWWWGRQAPGGNREWGRGILIGMGIVLALFFGGWLFVEVWPTRLWTALQTFRLVYAMKWFGFLLFAGTIARAWAAPSGWTRALGWLFLLPVGLAQPLGTLWAHGLEKVRRVIPERWRRLVLPFLAVLGFSGMAWILSNWPSHRDLPESITLLGILGLYGLFRARLDRPRRFGLAGVWVGALIGLLLANRVQPMPGVGRLLKPIAPILALADAKDPLDPLARFCRDHLPPDVLVLGPPDMGRFRLVAERAILADTKAFAHNDDQALMEWRRRMSACYGEAQSRSFFSAVREWDANYRRMDDQRRAELSRQFGATHAVLYLETPTDFPVSFADGNYKLVRLPGAPAISADSRGDP